MTFSKKENLGRDLALAVPLVITAFLAAGAAHATPMPVDLSTWDMDRSDASAAQWTVQGPDNDTVRQSINGNPTVFFGPGDAQGASLSGKITVEANAGDDDFIGFVLGYHDNDLSNSAANYLLIDWKAGDQGFFGCTAQAGLAISRITDVIELDSKGPWCHDSTLGVEELQRGSTLADTGWVHGTEYAFDIDFTATNVKVSVDGSEELNISGSFNNGSFGFYNYSQQNVVYSAIRQEDLPVPPISTDVPEPATLALFGIGLLGLGASSRRRKKEA